MNEHPFAYLKQRADLKRCCAVERNLVVARLRPDLLLAICRQCGRRHRKLTCEPGSIFAQALQSRPPLLIG